MIPERLSALAHTAWAVLLSLPLAACPADPPPQSPARAAPREVACALDGAAEFAASCTLEPVGDGWVLSRPDGGFVRLKRAKGGAVTTDGFPRVAARRLGGQLVLVLGHDRYRLPW